MDIRVRNVLSYLDLLIDISNGIDHDFDIVSFSDLSGNISTATAYDTYISQLIRCSWACHNYELLFLIFHACRKTFPPWVFCEKTDEKFYKCMGRYPELAKFNKSLSSMIYASVIMAQLHHAFSQLMK